MKRTIVAMAMLMLASAATVNAADERKSNKKTNQDQAETPATLLIAVVREGQSEARPLTEDETAIQKSADDYVKAFEKGDAKAATAQFTTDAEYVDAEGRTHSGRNEIEAVLKTFFEAHPGTKLSIQIESLRVISSTVAMEDGMTTLVFRDSNETVVFDYTAVHVKQDGKWLTASVREHPSKRIGHHRTQLKQMSWMLGDWVHEGDDSIVHFSCRPVDNGHFLLRNFVVQVGGQETMSGSQRIGWDPRAGKFRAWVFDSNGGYAEGDWHREGNNWILKLRGVTSRGESASSTSVYTAVDARTMTFQSLDHELGGVELPDSAPVTIVRQSPQPE